MVRIAKSQGQINDLMLALIQEIITLNVISYTYLADVISEFHASVKDGWRDTNGNVVTLTRAGKDFANQASAIFVKILEGSRSTREEIEGSRNRIAMLEQDLARKDDAIAGLQRATQQCVDRGDEQDRKVQAVEATLADTTNRTHDQADQLRKLQTSLLEDSNAARQEVEASRQRIATLEQDLARNDNDIAELGRVTRAFANRGDEQERKVQTVEASLEATVASANRIADETRKLRTLLYAVGAGSVVLAVWTVARALAGI